MSHRYCCLHLNFIICYLELLEFYHRLRLIFFLIKFYFQIKFGLILKVTCTGLQKKALNSELNALYFEYNILFATNISNLQLRL